MILLITMVVLSLSTVMAQVKDGKLILDASSEIDIVDLDVVYKFLLTPKNLREKINKLNISFTYLFDEKTININDIKVDGVSDEEISAIRATLSTQIVHKA